MCDVVLHAAYRSVLGVVAWTVLTRAEQAVYVQALQRRAHAPRIKDCTRFNLVIRYVKWHKCRIKSITLKHPLNLVGFIDAASTAQPEEPTGLVLRGLAAILQEDDHKDELMSASGNADLVEFTVRRHRRVAPSIFIAELYGLADSIEQLMSSQVALHQIYRGTAQSPRGCGRHIGKWQVIPTIGFIGRCPCRV